MKKLILLAVSAITLVAAEAQLRTPAPSPTQTIKQDFGISSVELTYSRPGMKGRKIFGDLVPFGKVWRTGANQATVITFADEVTIGDKKIAPGKYGLVTIPDKDNWTIIISKQLDITSPDAYKPENDVARAMAKPMALKDKVESFTMQFANVKSTACELQLMWENTAVSLPIGTEIDSKVMKQIEDQVSKDNRPYYSAALYYLDNGKDLTKAVQWFDKAIEQNPKAFWAYHQKANALAKMGKKEEAKTAANKSIELAREAKNDDFVKLNEKLLADLK